MNVDVLMATYNGEQFVEEQIESILSQTYPHIHLWIRDDGSSDGTLELIKKQSERHPGKITSFASNERLGPVGNFSKLLDASKAPYVMFADQDDWWYPDKIEKTLAKMQALEKEHTSLCPLLVHTDLKVVDEEMNLVHSSYWSYTRLYPERSHRLNKLLVQNVITGCTIMMNRQLVKIASPIPKETLMHDWWLGLVASAFGVIGIVPEGTILYRQHGKNTLGAKQFGSKEHLLSGYAKLLSPNLQKLKQAKAFLERYEYHLTAKQRHQVEVYLKLGQMPFLKSRYHVLKHGFFKQGVLRNLSSFLLQRQP